MRKGLKIALVIILIATILIASSVVITFVVIKKQHEPIPYDLDNAPKEILEIKDKLENKLVNATFTWEDMTEFLIFAQYVADNCPEILSIIEDSIELFSSK